MNKGLFFATWRSLFGANFKGVVDIIVHDGDEGKVLIGVAPVKYVEGKEVDVEVIQCSNVASSNDESTSGSLWLEIVNAVPSTLSIVQGTTHGAVSWQEQPWSASASDRYPSPLHIGLLDQHGNCLGAFRFEY